MSVRKAKLIFFILARQMPFNAQQGGDNKLDSTCCLVSRQARPWKRGCDLPGFSFALLSPPWKQGFVVELGDLQKVSGRAFGRIGDLAELEGNGTTRSSPRLAPRSRRSSASLQLAP